MLLYKPKKSQVGKGNKVLIAVTVLGSAGPLRFLVGEDELVAAVIDTTLKSYAREGRLPLLSCDISDFLLYSPSSGHEALSPLITIGSIGTRNFTLTKKPKEMKMEEIKNKEYNRKPSPNWRSWLHRSINMKITNQ